MQVYFLGHFRTSVSTSSSSATRLPPRWQCNDPVVKRYRPPELPTVNRKHFFLNIICIESFCPQNAQQHVALRYYAPQARPPCWLLKPTSEHEHARLLPRRSWNWTVLLPSGTHRKPITSITAVLLPSVTCLLALVIEWERSLFRIFQGYGVRYSKEVRLQQSSDNISTEFKLISRK
jgi:hypothetical protein